MSDGTWIPWAIKAPVPPGYDGYSNDPERRLDEIKYIVNHSAEGWKAALIKGHRPGQTASWTFSVLQNGDLYQHFPLEKLAYTSGSYEANRDGIGREHEGVKGQPLTAAQVATDRKLDAELERLCVGLLPLKLGWGYREHHELAPGTTSCPSGRIQPLYDSYNPSAEEDDLDATQAHQLSTVFHWLTDEVPFQGRTAPRIAVLESVYRILADDIDPDETGVQPRFGVLDRLKAALDKLEGKLGG